MFDPQLPAELLSRFQALIQRARESGVREPTAMTLATVDTQGQPSARVVLLRGYDEGGFVFYTNTLSRKGEQLSETPRAALCFYWEALGEQVRIEGRVTCVSQTEADDYWATRPRDSQIGAWASRQSRPLDDRSTLESAVGDFERKFADRDVPRPEHWSGYRLHPLLIEFWTNRPARLHDRIVYQWHAGEWSRQTLYP